MSSRTFLLLIVDKLVPSPPLDEIPDGNDHSIDAVRYAMMDDALRGA
ncbi:MAG: hypothetical protein IJ111_14610 [Eggerthellaceae bacterium]|nr:hypothetical protein [Eggerthellaceae bacterium]